MTEKTDIRDSDEKVVEIEMERLRNFTNHPFKVIGDSQMIELQDSIKKYGVLNPLIVRPRKEGYYEIISGHRRKYAAERLGYKKIPVIIRMMQDDEAVVTMVDSNLQREQITPSEKAYGKLIQKQETFCKITEFSSGKELLEFQDETNAEEIDILFLDISMGDEDGMTVAKQLRSQMESKKEAVWGSLPLLIFVTGYPEYMQEAFSVNAFQYIVKPIQESNFEQVFAQTIREYQYLMAKKKEKPKEVLVRNGNRTRSVSAAHRCRIW